LPPRPAIWRTAITARHGSITLQIPPICWRFIALMTAAFSTLRRSSGSRFSGGFGGASLGVV
jgi:hypothetical protein